ncbi:PREDICTED: probable leucine-rich repeat receptor-like serine/threonine-protein kinase At3g14840, partial [Erythranthe guttata]|uniref:probable leucine-rich repeat receptor-like serine/threonine-protein kinase At3g14840 n=1 Tax=Erythranthe guttata TaxID=4155 RepID=UPI00064DC83A
DVIIENSFHAFVTEYYSLRINCGGRQVADDKGSTYEDDGNSGGPTNFFARKAGAEDFNNEKEARGVNKGIKRNFTAVVADNTLDICFYWAGKGTNGIPVRGVYGPLISAICVDPVDWTCIKYPMYSNDHLRSWASSLARDAKPRRREGEAARRESEAARGLSLAELKGVDLHTGSFTLKQIKTTTNNFYHANKIGEGGFGPVFKGFMSHGTIIAVKQLSAKSKQGNRNQLLLVYEYLENNSFARALFGKEEHQIHLDWPTRHKICIGIARGLAYLQEESRLKIVHRDIKATNVLLDKDLMAKISDFGLAKLNEEDITHISTRVADKADVYSFGVVLLELISGKSNSSSRANSLNETGKMMDLVDPRLELKFKKKEVTSAINVAVHCTNIVATERPSISTVVSILEGKAGVGEFISYTSTSTDRTNPTEETAKQTLMTIMVKGRVHQLIYDGLVPQHPLPVTYIHSMWILNIERREIHKHSLKILYFFDFIYICGFDLNAAVDKISK